MVYWQEMPYPMQGGDKSFSYFSGGAVVDKNNTAGFGDSAIIAIYTMHMRNTKREMQGLSYSTDETNFQFYEKNPVLDLGTEFFRDPTVFWHTPTNCIFRTKLTPYSGEIDPPFRGN
jgi:sucrose-6-phosphate hydrolase SacC (GH32 family)